MQGVSTLLKGEYISMIADKYQFAILPNLRGIVQYIGLNTLIRTFALAEAFGGVVAHAVTQQALLVGLALVALVVFSIAWVRE